MGTDLEQLVGDAGCNPDVVLAARIQRGYRLLRQRNEARVKREPCRVWLANDAIDVGLARADATDNLRQTTPGEPLTLAEALEQATACGAIPAIHRGVVAGGV